jgi:hypothetical protein
MILEHVTFRLAEGVEADAFLSLNEGIDRFLRAQPGFEARLLAVSDDGTWVDELRWADRASAEWAAAAFPGIPEAAASQELLDPTSVSMRLLALRHEAA